MIYTVTLNPSVDYIIHVANIKLGNLNKMEKAFKFPGGKGINVSRILNELGTKSINLGFIGGFTGQFIENELKKAMIGTDFVHIKDDTRINVKLKSTDETEINAPGPAISEEEKEQLLKKLRQVQPEDIVIFSGSKPPSLPADFYETLVEITVQSKAQFVIDTASKELLSLLPRKPLLVKPNMEELEKLYEVKLTGMPDIVKYGKKLLESGAQNAIVSMGGEGALLFSQNRVLQGKSPKGTVKNSVGAGDSMIAGFISDYIKSKNIHSAFQMGIAAGSATAFSDDLAKRANFGLAG